MPVPKTWIPRIPSILAELESSQIEMFDRSQIESMFELQRRRALLLMVEAGAVKDRLGYLVSRDKLVTYVLMVKRVEEERRDRHQQTMSSIDRGSAELREVREYLSRNQKEQLRYSLTEEVLEASITSLPQGVHIIPGQIVIEVNDASVEDACQKLYALGIALANDLAGFERLLKGKTASKETVVEDLLQNLEADKATGIAGVASSPGS
jgi:hypothetical protein